MGTRADFYLGRGENSQWLGSIAFDGYPDGCPEEHRVIFAKTEEDYIKAVSKALDSDSGTLPKDGWPWPWDNSKLTDYSYAFEDAQVWASNFGSDWFRADEKEPEEKGKGAIFPDMKSIQNVAFGKRSGLIVINVGKIEEEKS